MQLGNPSALIPHSGQPVPQQGTDKSLKLSLPFHDSPAGPWGWGRVQEPVYSEWHCQGGTGSPPHWEPCRAPSPPVLHSPTSTSPAQALPVATASWEKSTLNSGDSSAVGGDSTGRQILRQNSPKQSPAPGPWLSEHLLNCGCSQRWEQTGKMPSLEETVPLPLRILNVNSSPSSQRRLVSAPGGSSPCNVN